MYSGITQGLFVVKSVIKHKNLFHYCVVLNEKLVKDLQVGASIAVDGVCQTVVAINGIEVSFDAIQETLTQTTLNDLFVGRKVSIERSVRYGEEMGGHELSGHIFETGQIIDKKISENNLALTIHCSKACFAFIKPKAYIALDGSSLTVGLTDKKEYCFEVYLIPETLRKTNFSNKDCGDKVNIEPDMKTMMLVKSIQNYFSNINARLTNLEKQFEKIMNEKNINLE
ncbi:riboflavin synthase subunit alpha [Rickettsiella grylli]|uniref:riboflavin synthase n=1 Tax=Rickettsiella grylli TaxID=59196 RepID=UPI0008FD1015|nr:riboflavin synthase [Rickettsiella grylli]OIZ99506.1 riboflavin synthase subunit alpha [Rickettsiella grylli]